MKDMDLANLVMHVLVCVDPMVLVNISRAASQGNEGTSLHTLPRIPNHRPAVCCVSSMR